MREDVSGFQTKIQSAIEDHKSQMEDAFKELTARFEKETQLDDGFTETVSEHLKLAKDEGARITAQAVAEAEQFDQDNRVEPEANFSELRDAISNISKQESQADILKSLVEHASQFTPRGAFFIIKNDHFVGWRVFGKEEQNDDQAIRDIFFPVSQSTVLSQAAQSLETAEGSFGSDGDEAAYLNKLDFGQPDRMYAIPLIARGRSVAVLYADYGEGGTNVNVEALETLVQVSGLTVELLAAARSSNSQKAVQTETAPAVQKESNDRTIEKEEPQESYSYQEPDKTDKFEQVSETASSEFKPAESKFSYDSYDKDLSAQPETPETFATEFQSVSEDSDKNDWSQSSEITDDEETEVEEIPAYSDQFETESYQPVAVENDFEEAERNEYQFDNSQFDNSQFDNNQFETPSQFDESKVETEKPDNSQFESFDQPESVDNSTIDSFAPVATEDYSQPTTDFGAYDPASSYTGDTATPEPVSEPVVEPPVSTRFSDRNVDLPIEVGEDERRLHNDARRFARLLVSEIKLYNEQKVKEGRESSDVYERLREAIDRSREMYDKRVQSPVAAKFDYFHYELVNSLGDGDESVLGNSYPGASI